MGMAQDMRNLTNDIANSYDARVQSVAILSKETAKMIKGFHAAHKKMSDELKKSLAQGEESRLKDFEALHSNIDKDIAVLKKEAVKMIKGFHAAHKEMAAQLKDALAKGEVQRIEDFKAMDVVIKQRVATVQKETGQLLKDFRAEQAKMAAEWKKLASTMAHRRGETPPKAAPKKAARVAEEAEEAEKGKMAASPSAH